MLADIYSTKFLNHDNNNGKIFLLPDLPRLTPIYDLVDFLNNKQVKYFIIMERLSGRSFKSDEKEISVNFDKFNIIHCGTDWGYVLFTNTSRFGFKSRYSTVLLFPSQIWCNVQSYLVIDMCFTEVMYMITRFLKMKVFI